MKWKHPEEAMRFRLLAGFQPNCWYCRHYWRGNETIYVGSGSVYSPEWCNKHKENPASGGLSSAKRVACEDFQSANNAIEMAEKYGK